VKTLTHLAGRRRTTISVVAVAGCLTLMSACGSAAKPADSSSGDSGGSSENKTIVFSPLGLQIPAMQDLSKGVQDIGKSQGYTVIVQDPKLNPQKQVQDLQSVVETGKAGGVWALAVQPSSMTALVKTAQEKKISMILNGTPEEFGLDGLQPGLSFSRIDYDAQGQALGEELGNCINEKSDGKAEVIFEENAPGTAGKKDLETAAKKALAETAPNAKIVATVVAEERAHVQTDIGSAIQAHPNATAVLANRDEGSLGALGAFAAAGKKLDCITEAGGNAEVLAAVKAGKIYASVALQFAADTAQSFKTLTEMMADPSKEGVQLTVPQKVIKAEG
jgi:ribose transport system substrate-binding protein